MNLCHLVSFVVAASAAASQPFSYTSGYNGKTFTLEPVPERAQVSFHAHVSAEKARTLLSHEGVAVERMARAAGPYALVQLEPDDGSAMRRLEAHDEVMRVMPLLRDQEGFLKTFAPAELTVQFRPGLSEEREQQVIDALGTRIIRRQRTPGYYTLGLEGDAKLFPTIRAFNQHDAVWFAELSAFGFDDALYRPNDSRYSEQWSLNNTGQSGGTHGADIHAEEAWDLHQGDPDVIISVIDTGIDWDHPDLASKIVPIGNEDWNFSGPGRIPHDSGSHGTACNGIAGAVTGNSQGMAGVAPKCGLMPLKVDLAAGQNQNRADAINYVASRADDFTHIVVSCSWRMSAGDFTAVEAACQNAHDAGVLLMFSSGNDDGAINYPALYPTTVAVGATSPCDERKSPSSCDGESWWGSNYGDELNLVAPGVKILTTSPGGGYTTTFNGTSSACPHAAGAMALVWSVAPDLSPEEALDVAQSTADDQVGRASEDTPGWDRYMGWGRINLHAALVEAESRAQGLELELTPDSELVFLPSAGGEVAFDWRVGNQGDGPRSFEVWLDAGYDGLADGELTVLGPYTVRLAAGGERSGRTTVPVPGPANDGYYTAYGRLGAHPGTVEVEDSFRIYKGDSPPGSTIDFDDLENFSLIGRKYAGVVFSRGWKAWASGPPYFTPHTPPMVAFSSEDVPSITWDEPKSHVSFYQSANPDRGYEYTYSVYDAAGALLESVTNSGGLQIPIAFDAPGIVELRLSGTGDWHSFQTLDTMTAY